VQGAGCRVQGAGCMADVGGHLPRPSMPRPPLRRTLLYILEFRVYCLGSGVWGSGCGIGVWGRPVRFRVEPCFMFQGFRVHCGFGVQGVGLEFGV